MAVAVGSAYEGAGEDKAGRANGLRVDRYYLPAWVWVVFRAQDLLPLPKSHYHIISYAVVRAHTMSETKFNVI